MEDYIYRRLLHHFARIILQLQLVIGAEIYGARQNFLNLLVQ